MNKFLKVLAVTVLEFGLLFWLFNWHLKLYHPTYVSFGVLLFVFWLGVNGALVDVYLNKKKGYSVKLKGMMLIYSEGKNKLELSEGGAFSEKVLPYSFLELPDEKSWRQTMPDWAKEHRARIVQNIKTELGDEDWRYVEIDGDKMFGEEQT